MTDPATNPNAPGRQVGGGHYGGTKFQHWDWVEWNGMGYQEGQISRYVLRHAQKQKELDLEKAIHHTEKLISQYLDPDLARRNRAYYRFQTRSGELFALMHTPGWEQEIAELLRTWKDADSLRTIISEITLLKEHRYGKGSTTSGTQAG